MEILRIVCTQKAFNMLKVELRNNNLSFMTERTTIIVDDLPKSRMAIKMIDERLGKNAMIVHFNKSTNP